MHALTLMCSTQNNGRKRQTMVAALEPKICCQPRPCPMPACLRRQLMAGRLVKREATTNERAVIISLIMPWLLPSRVDACSVIGTIIMMSTSMIIVVTLEEGVNNHCRRRRRSSSWMSPSSTMAVVYVSHHHRRQRRPSLLPSPPSTSAIVTTIAIVNVNLGTVTGGRHGESEDADHNKGDEPLQRARSRVHRGR
jgi:hypothetical protein